MLICFSNYLIHRTTIAATIKIDVNATTAAKILSTIAIISVSNSSHHKHSIEGIGRIVKWLVIPGGCGIGKKMILEGILLICYHI
jgi:hypothetical protein